MKFGWAILGVLSLSTSLAGCAVPNLLGGDSTPATTAPTTVRTGNNLALPPDLRLAAPTTVSDEYQPNTVGTPPPPILPAGTVTASTPAAPGSAAAPTKVASATPVAPAAPAPDIYAQYGISKTTPDGKPKNQADLQAELKAAMIAKKRATNPGYGTIFNIGNIFNDG